MINLDIKDVFFDLDHTLWDFDKNSKITFETIFSRNHPEVQIEDFIKDMQTPFPFYRRDYKKHLINVILEVDESKAFYFENKKYLKSQELIEKKENGNLLLSFKVTQEMEIEELIKKWIPFVKVVEIGRRAYSGLKYLAKSGCVACRYELSLNIPVRFKS